VRGGQEAVGERLPLGAASPGGEQRAVRAFDFPNQRKLLLSDHSPGVSEEAAADGRQQFGVRTHER
ncbi:hypothetical protein ACFCX4_19520, partial [Kitasatospora sp. NPDC056327]|uniref:hypothetical protein n=1 Tax=Kitasatospora sp. NPDC056327 TaxID=3345785 RepID=UPI0035E34B3D